MKYHNFLPKLSFIPSIVICKDHAVFLSNPPSPPPPKKNLAAIRMRTNFLRAICSVKKLLYNPLPFFGYGINSYYFLLRSSFVLAFSKSMFVIVQQFGIKLMQFCISYSTTETKHFLTKSHQLPRLKFYIIFCLYFSSSLWDALS